MAVDKDALTAARLEAKAMGLSEEFDIGVEAINKLEREDPIISTAVLLALMLKTGNRTLPRKEGDAIARIAGKYLIQSLAKIYGEDKVEGLLDKIMKEADDLVVKVFAATMKKAKRELDDESEDKAS